MQSAFSVPPKDQGKISHARETGNGVCRKEFEWVSMDSWFIRQRPLYWEQAISFHIKLTDPSTSAGNLAGANRCQMKWQSIGFNEAEWHVF